KQPSPNIACSVPAGNGGSSRAPFTWCFSGTGIFSARPGSDCSLDGTLAFLSNNTAASNITRVGTHPHALLVLGEHQDHDTHDNRDQHDEEDFPEALRVLAGHPARVAVDGHLIRLRA